MWSDLTLDLSFKVKQGQPHLKMLITSGISSPYVFYYCFYRFPVFGDTPPARNKTSGISLVPKLYLNTSSSLSGDSNIMDLDVKILKSQIQKKLEKWLYIKNIYFVLEEKGVKWLP